VGADPLATRVVVIAAALLSSTLAGADASRLRVCALSFQGPDEIRVFEERLPPDDFDVVDLSPHRLPAADATDDAPPESPWLFDLCRPDVRCDVVVLSAEFAGRFFGAYGQSLGLADMEDASCQPRCAGLFHRPREVFLLGCNTLATKASDTRTPDDYLRVLLDHGFDRAAAERVVGTRYGPLGPSFRESLRRIFMGVPRLYGFASVAPTADRTAPLLERYFDAKGDYRRWLDEADRDPGRNTELLAAFRGTGLVQTSGLADDERAAADRDLVCRLHDEREPVAARLDAIADAMARDDVLSFVPTIERFIDRHPPETLAADAAAIFEDIERSEGARAQVMALVHALDVSALQLELAHFASRLGWLSDEEFRALAIDGVRELLRRPLTTGVVDVVCETSRHAALGDEFGSDDVRPRLFEDPEGLRLVDCLAPRDARVSERLVAALDRPDLPTRLWAAYTLSHRLPLDDAILLRLAAELDDPSPDLRARLRWTLTAARPLSDTVVHAVAVRDPAFAAGLALPARRRRGSGVR
jgi:hypothetical protein